MQAIKGGQELAAIILVLLTVYLSTIAIIYIERSTVLNGPQ